MFRVLVDADACPVYRIAERLAKEKNVPVILFSRCQQLNQDAWLDSQGWRLRGC